jgi:hypothetical protein
MHLRLREILRWNQICDEIKAILVIVLFFRASVKWHFFKSCLRKQELHVCFLTRFGGGSIRNKMMNKLPAYLLCLFPAVFPTFLAKLKIFYKTSEKNFLLKYGTFHRRSQTQREYCSYTLTGPHLLDAIVLNTLCKVWVKLGKEKIVCLINSPCINASRQNYLRSKTWFSYDHKDWVTIFLNSWN